MVNIGVQYSTVQYSTVQYSTVQYSTVQYSTVQYSTVYVLLLSIFFDLSTFSSHKFSYFDSFYINKNY